MAKSKKALKALKRRKEAQKRSRFVKERQDYRAGGRVKAFPGGGFQIPQSVIDKAVKASEDFTKQNTSTPLTNTATPSPAVTSTPPAATSTPLADTTSTSPTQAELDAQAQRDQEEADRAREEENNRRAREQAEEQARRDAEAAEANRRAVQEEQDRINRQREQEQAVRAEQQRLRSKQLAEEQRKKRQREQAEPTIPEPTEEDTTLNFGTSPGGYKYTAADYDNFINSGGIDSNNNNQIDPDEREAHKALLAQRQADEDKEATLPVITKGFDGKEYPDSAAAEAANARLLEEAIFDYSDINIPLNSKFGSEVRYIRINDGTGNRQTVVPWFALTEAQRQNLINVYNAFPTPQQETQRATEAYKVLSNIFTVKGLEEEEEPEEEEEETPEEETPEEEAPEDDKPPYVEEREITYYEVDPQQANFLQDGYINVEALNFSSDEQEIFDLNLNRWDEKNPMPDMFVTATGGAVDPGIGSESGQDPADSDQDGVKTNPAWTNWVTARKDYHNRTVRRILDLARQGGNPGDPGYGDILPLPQTNRQFRFGTQVGYKIPGLVADDPERADVEELAEVADADTFQIDRYERDADGNIIFDSEGNPVLKLQRAVAPGEIDPDALTTTDATGTSATLKATAEVAQSLGINAPTVKAYTAAASNYFLKYPEAQAAVEAGEYTDFLDYHNKVGQEKGNVLGFDSTKFATKEIETLGRVIGAFPNTTEAAARIRADEKEAIADTTEFKEDTRSVVDPATGEVVELAATANAEKQSRKAITDEEAAQGTEAIIQGSIGYEAAQRRQVTGEAAKGAARTLLQEVGELPADISEAILDNPAVVTAQVDTQPIQVQAAIAALPNEALVSVQLENLLAGIDEGVTPTWARPAVRLVESNLAARGLSVSTVGRDALFNSIIQSAIPLAQSNATALQQRAAQNLSNEQQANLQRSSQEMQLRLTNVANRQSAESQSAQLAQQINLTQKQFTQQAELTEAEQRQQVRIASLQNEQQAEMANLGNDQQIELANLQVEAERLGANQTASNQERMAEMQVAASFLQKNAEFKQQMEVANLSSDQQMRLAFLTAKNQAEAQNLTAAQQTELANLSKRLEVNKTNASLAQQMGLAQLTVDQQAAMQNAATVANIDLTKFNVEQQVELANSKFIQTSTLQDLNNRQQTILQDATSLASMKMQEADNNTKVSIENARNFLAMDMANLNNEQQAYMLDSQQAQQRLLSDLSIQNAARQFNATSDLQTQQFVTTIGSQLTQFNAQQANAMAQFNQSETNRMAAIAAGNELAADQFNAQIQAQISQFNSQQDLQVEQFNTANSQAVEQSNVEWRRKANLADTAATNAANQQQAAFQFDLNKTSLSQAWQSLRDQANFDFQEWQSEKERKISAINALLANESFMSDDKYTTQRARFFALLDQFSVSITALQDSDDFILPGDLYEGAEDDEET